MYSLTQYLPKGGMFFRPDKDKSLNPTMKIIWIENHTAYATYTYKW